MEELLLILLEDMVAPLLEDHHMDLEDPYDLEVLEDLEVLLPPFHTPGSRGRNLQATRCVLGGKSRVKAVTLFLTPPFRLNS